MLPGACGAGWASKSSSSSRWRWRLCAAGGVARAGGGGGDDMGRGLDAGARRGSTKVPGPTGRSGRSPKAVLRAGAARIASERNGSDRCGGRPRALRRSRGSPESNLAPCDGTAGGIASRRWGGAGSGRWRCAGSCRGGLLRRWNVAGGRSPKRWRNCSSYCASRSARCVWACASVGLGLWALPRSGGRGASRRASRGAARAVSGFLSLMVAIGDFCVPCRLEHGAGCEPGTGLCTVAGAALNPSARSSRTLAPAARPGLRSGRPA